MPEESELVVKLELRDLPEFNEMLDRVVETVKRVMDSCGNRFHPDGPWHPMADLPTGWLERFRQYVRRIRWGCGCPRLAPGGENASMDGGSSADPGENAPTRLPAA